jgi:hypothetical protein
MAQWRGERARRDGVAAAAERGKVQEGGDAGGGGYGGGVKAQGCLLWQCGRGAHGAVLVRCGLGGRKVLSARSGKSFKRRASSGQSSGVTEGAVAQSCTSWR